MRRHVILIGLPGAGKTTVGRLVAVTLAAPFLDLDEEIERHEGATIPDLFQRIGEPGFRDLERAAMRRALAGEPAVVGAGGGWAAQHGNLAAAADALVLYLYTTPTVAAARTAAADNRPLIRGDPAIAVADLLAQREQFYRRADVMVVTDERSPAQVAAEVAALARERGGW